MYYGMPGSLSLTDYSKMIRKFYELLATHKAMKKVLGIL
jgi:hypothetical protein